MKLSFNTSSNNHARIYLQADTCNLALPLNGYFLQTGGGDDSIFIMKQAGIQEETVYRFKSCKTSHSTNTMRFRITRDEAGQWQAMIDTTGASDYIADGTFYDDSFQSCRWFGLFCRYTTSNAAKFYFDDFYIGPILHDTLPARIRSVKVPDAKTVQVEFSETVQKGSAENTGNYRFHASTIHIDSARQDVISPDIVTLFLHDSLPDGTTDSLRIRQIPDLAGNIPADTVVQVCYYLPKAYDILIHEILSDPDPPAGMPNGEFVELFNRSDFPVNLQGWTFGYGSYAKVFPGITVPSKGYLLIARDSVYLDFASCAVLFTSSSSLSNEGTVLILKDNHGRVIHTVSYHPDWYRGSFKEEGGWSLEMMDPGNPCGCMENWVPSTDVTGGTPGRENSVSMENPDLDSPAGLRAILSDSVLLRVTFSEMMDSTSIQTASPWTVVHPGGEVYPIRVKPVPPDFTVVEMLFGTPFVTGVIYALGIPDNLKDCAGNFCDPARSIRFAIPAEAAKQDVIINELLSNPAAGGSRFVELYNRSEKIIDLQALVLSGRDTSAGLLPGAAPLPAAGYLLFPGDYVALTSSPGEICERYHPPTAGTITGMPGFPTLGDDTGTVILARKDNLAIIDRMSYNPEMHFPLLATSEGVSLERTSPDLPSEEVSNWHSAAETIGFATPGYHNSHWIMPVESSGEIMITPAVFSPDNDGYDDLLTIVIRGNAPDCAVTISVYDSRGRFVRQIANNILTGSEVVFLWDGMNAGRSKVPIGFYIVLTELVRPDGTVRKSKRTVVVGGKL